jgi:microcystin-dependent protein
MEVTIPYNGSGIFTPPPSPGAFNPALSGQLATPDAWNTLLTDIANALSLAVCRDGQSSVIGNINMGGFKVTNLGTPTAASDAASKSYVDSSISGNIPAGLIWIYAGPAGSIPAGWYLCDGSLKNRTTDAALFTAISTTYGAGDGSTTFALPDCRGRVIAMLDGGTGTLGAWATLGADGGEASHILTAAEMPTHGHGVNDPGHGHAVSDPGHFHNVGVGVQNYGAPSGGGLVAAGSTNTDTRGTGISIVANGTSISIQANGGSAAHNVVQPTIIMNMIIKH